MFWTCERVNNVAAMEALVSQEGPSVSILRSSEQIMDNRIKMNVIFPVPMFVRGVTVRNKHDCYLQKRLIHITYSGTPFDFWRSLYFRKSVAQCIL